MSDPISEGVDRGLGFLMENRPTIVQFSLPVGMSWNAATSLDISAHRLSEAIGKKAMIMLMVWLAIFYLRFIRELKNIWDTVISNPLEWGEVGRQIVKSPR